MFGFGWVRTHLGDVFLESIRVFFFWLDFWKKERNQQIPRSSVGSRQGVAYPRRGEGLRRSVAVLCRGIVLFTDMCFCHVLLFRYSEDLPIGLMRTL